MIFKLIWKFQLEEPYLEEPYLPRTSGRSTWPLNSALQAFECITYFRADEPESVLLALCSPVFSCVDSEDTLEIISRDMLYGRVESWHCVACEPSQKLRDNIFFNGRPIS